MYYNREMRTRAWQALKGRWNIFYPIMLLTVVFADAFGLGIVWQDFFSNSLTVPFTMFGRDLSYAIAIPRGFGCVLAGISLAFMLCGLAMNTGEYRVARAAAGHEALHAGQLFPRDVFFKALIMNLVQYLIIMVGTMLFIVPGIVCSCNYAMANYLLANDPTLGPIEALRLSRERMYGKRMQYLSLQLSFMPWALGIYLLLSIVSSLIYNLTWSGDIIYTLVSWATSAFILGYMRVTSYMYFAENGEAARSDAWTDSSEEQPSAEETPDYEKEAAEKAQREAEAENLYRSFNCSHEALNASGRLEYYRSLNLSAYREDALRTQYGRDLMLRFDSDPGTFDLLIALCEEYSMDGLTDRMVARLYRYDRERNIAPKALLSMIARMLKLLRGGAFAQDPGFAARKQADLLKLADSVKTHAEEADPDGSWKEAYHAVCEQCGIEEN